MPSPNRQEPTLGIEVPAAMRSNGRAPDDDFGPDELLFRRFPPQAFVDNELELDSVQLPDISTMRQRYTEDPCWVLLDVTGKQDFSSWGIAAVRISKLPREVWHHATNKYDFVVAHAPLSNNYPHSEIRAFDSSRKHLRENSEIPPDVGLCFRERLLRVMKVHRRPTASSARARLGS